MSSIKVADGCPFHMKLEDESFGMVVLLLSEGSWSIPPLIRNVLNVHGVDVFTSSGGSMLNLLGLGTLTMIKKRTWLPIMLIMLIGIDKSIAYKYTITSDKLLDSAGVRVGVRDSRTSRSY